MAKAERSLGELKPITSQSRLIDPDSCKRIIASFEADMAPATRDDLTSTVAELIACYRDLSFSQDRSRQIEMQASVVKLAEAFSPYPAAVCKAAVHAATGIPATVKYWPKPHDVVTFCEALMLRRRTVIVMAQRHLDEARNRWRERKEESTQPQSTPEQRAAAVARWNHVKAGLTLKSMSGAA
jgi:hypothetical protein